MATQAPPQPVSRHYLSQAGLAIVLARAVRHAWPTLDLSRTRATLPSYTRQIEALVDRFSRTSSTLAAREYQRQRRAAGIRSSFTVPHAAPPNAEKVERSLSWATHQLRDGTLDELTGTDLTQQVEAIQQTVEGVAEKLTLDTGRLTMVEAVNTDRRAHSWAREARPTCCYFCAMLATRGGVYHSEGSAGADANERFDGEGDFKFHDNCRCQVVPVFGLYEPPAHARQWAAEWERLKEQNGGSLSLSKWREHFDAPKNDPQPAGS